MPTYSSVVKSVICALVGPRLTGFLLGELPVWQLRLVAAHVGACPRCAAELSTLGETVHAVEGLQESAPCHLPPLTRAERAHLHALVRRRRPRPAKLVWAFAATAVLVLGLLSLRPQALPTPIMATVVQTVGQPEYRIGEGRWHPLTTAADLRAGAEVRTGERDQLQVEFADGSQGAVGFSTSLRIDSRPAAARGKWRPDLRLHSGRVAVLVTPDRVGLRVHTQMAMAEALGTVFEVEAGPSPSREARKDSPSEALVTVLRGKVRVSNRHGSVLTEGGFATRARAEAAPAEPQPATGAQSVLRRLPWGGGPRHQVWSLPPLDAREAARRLAGRRGWIGIELAQATLSPSGEPVPAPALTVARVAPNSPAAQAGVLVGDQLLTVGPWWMERPGDLWRTELLAPAGTQVRLRLRRGMERRSLSLICAESPERTPAASTAALESANRAFASGNLQEAEAGYEELARRQLPAAIHNLGVLKELRGDTPAAALLYRQAVDQDPSVARFHYSLGLALSRKSGFLQGNLPGAIEQLQATLARDPDFPRASFLLGRMQAFAGDLAAAQQQIVQLCATPQTRAQGLCLAGELAQLRDDLAGAARSYYQAAEADPLALDPPLLLGAVYFLQGRYAEAHTWSTRALQIDPDSVQALLRLGQIASYRGDDVAALRLYRRAKQAHPEDAGVYSSIGRAYYRLGNYPQARWAFREALAREPNSTYPHLGLAMVYEKSGETRLAVQECQLALRLDPTYRPARLYFASLLRDHHQTHLALQVERAGRDYQL